ncbi:hypothetical protein AAC387_Pa03g1205 [Persea americana]
METGACIHISPGFAVGASVLLNVLSAESDSGASMNPVRSLGPAIVFNRYEGIWVYMAGPICGTVMGAWAYNLIRYTDKPLHEIIQSTSFKKSAAKAGVFPYLYVSFRSCWRK